jgi:CBS domain-containing protein
MHTNIKPLFSLTAHDLMSTTVLAIPQAMSLTGAAHLLAQAGISGAPVVDTEGRCVGVISAHDFVSWAEKGQHAAKRSDHSTCAHSAWQVIDIEMLPEDEVRCFMTADPVTVRPATPLAELAQMMVDAHIHRVIVVDAGDRPVGIVSSTDILAAVANSAKRSLAGAR